MQAGINSCHIGMLFACFTSGAMLAAQQPAGIQSESGVYTLHADTHLILLDVTAIDKQGHPVAGLTQDQFKVLEDGQPQTIKFFEEHAPVDPTEIARQKAAALASQPPNTFTNYEPFSGRPVTVLLLNEVFPTGVARLHQAMLEVVQKSPPDTPFAVYVLDPELRLVQSVTTDRALLAAKIDEIAMWRSPVWLGAINNWRTMSVNDLIAARRDFMTAAMQQLTAGFKDTPGRKQLFAFTGGFQCSVVVSDGKHGAPPCPAYGHFGKDKEFLCGLEDTLEQGRIWIYRYYGEDEIAYGFGCSATGAGVRDLSHYYTLYYTPANRDWSGKYRATTVEVADKGLRLAYRKGYYGTPANAEAHYYTAQGPAAAPVVPQSGGATIAATTVVAGTASTQSVGAAPAETQSTQQIQLHRRGSESQDTGAAKPPPNPASAVFSVQVIPADATVIPPSAKSAAEKEKQEYRQLTLRFSMPASEFQVVQSDSGQYAARLEIEAVGYADGRSLETYGSQVAAKFDGPADPRIATSTITAKLTVTIPEHGRSRWLEVSVRDATTGRLGSLMVPMGQVKVPETH